MKGRIYRGIELLNKNLNPFDDAMDALGQNNNNVTILFSKIYKYLIGETLNNQIDANKKYKN
jgi:hypothetical protein